MRDIIALACTECKRRNYSTTKNKKKTTERLEIEQVLPLLPEAHAPQGERSRVWAWGLEAGDRFQTLDPRPESPHACRREGQ